MPNFVPDKAQRREGALVHEPHGRIAVLPRHLAKRTTADSDTNLEPFAGASNGVTSVRCIFWSLGLPVIYNRLQDHTCQKFCGLNGDRE
jgi:hypothetical protein